MIPRFRLLAAGTLALLTLAACSNNKTAASEATKTAPSLATEADHAFIDGMVPHHGMANKAADSALARAVHPELKDFAQTMKTDQSQEIALMKGWKQDWFGTDSTPMPMTPGTFPPDSAFDLGWMQMLVSHHQGAIDMASLALDAGLRSPADSLARHIIDEQKREMAQLRSWAQQWYGVTLNVAPTTSDSAGRR